MPGVQKSELFNNTLSSWSSVRYSSPASSCLVIETLQWSWKNDCNMNWSLLLFLLLFSRHIRHRRVLCCGCMFTQRCTARCSAASLRRCFPTTDCGSRWVSSSRLRTVSFSAPPSTLHSYVGSLRRNDRLFLGRISPLEVARVDDRPRRCQQRRGSHEHVRNSVVTVSYTHLTLPTIYSV